MLILTVVFSLIFATLAGIIYIAEENKISEKLEDSIDVARNNVVHLPSISPKPDDKIYDVDLTVFVGNNGNIVSHTNTGLNQNELYNAVSFAMSYEQNRGNIGKSHLSFLKYDLKDGTLLSFVSREHLEERVRENLWHTALAAIFSLIAFFFISKNCNK